MSSVSFTVTHLHAEAGSGVPVTWQGRELPSGPLLVDLADSARSGGWLDHSQRRATAVLHVRLRFPELADLLNDLGVHPSFTEPVQATIRSTGGIMDDGGLALSGDVELAPHRLVSSEDGASGRVLPGR
jgi:hypothetical protein